MTVAKPLMWGVVLWREHAQVVLPGVMLRDKPSTSHWAHLPTPCSTQDLHRVECPAGNPGFGARQAWV